MLYVGANKICKVLLYLATQSVVHDEDVFVILVHDEDVFVILTHSNFRSQRYSAQHHRQKVQI